MGFNPNDVVKTCPRIESGLRLGPDAIRPCILTVFESPIFWKAEEVPEGLTKKQIMEKREELFLKLNDEHSEIACKSCLKAEEKKFKDVRFDKLGFIDLAHYSFCNLRCDYCGFTKTNSFHKAKYDPVPVLSQFCGDDVEFDSSVDFNGGEPSLLPNLADYFSMLSDLNIRTRLYTNAIRHRQEIEDAVSEGIISSLIISVDAGSKETYFLTKQRDQYAAVIENIRRYSAACKFPKSGRVASKYVFTAANCSWDDINGYVADMEIAKPQEVWLLYDFGVIREGVHNQISVQIEAYAKMYLAFLERGIKPLHFYESFLDPVVQDSRDLMELTRSKIKELQGDKCIETMPEITAEVMSESQIIDALLDPSNSTCVMAPANLTTQKILDHLGNGKCDILVADRCIHKSGKSLNGSEVIHYADLVEKEFDAVIVTSDYHYDAIVSEVNKYKSLENIQIIRLNKNIHVAL